MKDFKPRVLLIGAVCLVLAGGLGVSLFNAIHSKTDNSAEAVFEIHKGDGLRAVARRLRAEGILDWPNWFAFRAYWRGVSEDLKYGEYLISAHAGTDQIIEQFAAGKVRKHYLTIVEGWTFEQLLRAINEHQALSHKAASAPREQLFRDLGFDSAYPEGRFYPDTYVFSKGYSDLELLKRAHKVMDTALAAEWERRQPGLPYRNAYEALILASIVERETRLDHERPKVAGVFVRRLQRGMRLQADPTVIYGMGSAYRGDITRDALLRDTPYNTYTRAGLPPTPISLPGIASLRAALNPEQSGSLYFVAAGDGSHVFSSTLAEHERAVAAMLARRHETR